jgi:hypothetical protein
MAISRSWSLKEAVRAVRADGSDVKRVLRTYLVISSVIARALWTCLGSFSKLHSCSNKRGDKALASAAALGVYSRPLLPQLMHAACGCQSRCSQYGFSTDLSVGKHCSRALDWVCLPVHWPGTLSHAPVAARPLWMWVVSTQCPLLTCSMLTASSSMLNAQCSTPPSLLTLRAVQGGDRTARCRCFRLRHLSVMALPATPVVALIGASWSPFSASERSSARLVCRGNPPVWSGRVGRLPAMQLDGKSAEGTKPVHLSRSHHGSNWRRGTSAILVSHR